MHHLRLGYLLFVPLIIIQNSECNPVPNPGIQQFGDYTMPQTHWNQRLIWEYAKLDRTANQGEGSCGTTTTRGATTWEQEFINTCAKRGEPLPMGSGLNQRNPKYTQVQKRSYHRACKRAMQFGSTWYRGRVIAHAEFPREIQQRISAQMHRHASRAQSKPSLQGPMKQTRLRFLTWNPGGMAQGKLVEIRQWLQQHPHDVVVLPETRWGFERCWSDDKWHYVHSHTGQHRVGGILVMIARHLIDSEHIGFDVVLPGRILHIRLHFLSSAIDIMAVYQFADSTSTTQQQYRQQFCEKLDNHIYTLPSRNQMICCGDFNCALAADPPWTGTGTFRWKHQQHCGHQHRDMPRFHQLLHRHSLTAANAWSAAIGPSYFHTDYAARIDFFLIRMHSCDGATKSSYYLHEAEFLPINQTHHFPLVCTIPKVHMQFHKQQYKPACNYRQRSQCRQASLQETEEWLQLSRNVAASCLRRLMQADPKDDCISELHQELIPTFHELFPGKIATQSHTDTDAVQPVLHNKWYHRKCMRLYSHATWTHPISKCFKVWYHWRQFRQRQRDQQRHARWARLRRFQTLCEEAQEAAEAHDAHAMFQIINRHTPKRPLMRARIKTEDGKIADQYMAHRMTLEHVAHTWQGPEDLQPISECTPGVPIEIEDIEQAIMQLHPNKSVACPYLPAIIWKSAPHELACLIHQQLVAWWSAPRPIIPQEWRDAWLFFLPKPGKPGTHPRQMRPISLMEPIGKLILGLLTDQLKAFHLQRLCAEPHFGFLPRRSALDAVRRVVTHCTEVRTLIALQRRTIARQIANPPSFTFCGGLQMYLDLQHAFDSVHRPRLFRHLQFLGTPEHLLHLITQWHIGTRYNLMHQGQTTSIAVNVGLRQGCKAAPLLWVLFMNHFLHQLSSLIDRTWINKAITLYADDIHVGAIFYSIEEYHQCRQRFGCILDVLETLKLELSYEKTFIILATAGSSVRKGLKSSIVRRRDGATIAIPRADRADSMIPLKSKGKYLGTELSYGHFELQTWHLRLKAGKSAFARLRCWFRNKQLTMPHRVHLWQTCVHTILVYGLCATHVNVKILHEYQQTVYQMMRTVLHDHAYSTHKTHQQVFHAHGLELPLQLFARHVAQYWHRLQRRDLTLQNTDFLHRVDWSHLPELQKLIQCVAESTIEAPLATDASDPVQTQAMHQCPYCTFQTHSIPNLRRHMTQKHDCRQYRTSSKSPLEMTVNGKPQCNNCHMAFTTWRRFFIHVERNCCQVSPTTAVVHMAESTPAREITRAPSPALEADVAGQTTAAMLSPDIQLAVTTEPFWPLLHSVITSAQYDRLTDDPRLGDYLTHQCAICSSWCNRCQEMNAHLRLHHSEMMQGVLARGAQITHQLDPQSPCRLCNKTFRRSHCCSVANQVALLQLHCMSPTDKADAVKTCIICNQVHEGLGPLHRHLSNFHNISVNDWCPSRDSLQNSDACSHCGATFLSRSGLQRHILDGKCQFFNPAASPQTLQAADKWQEILHQGDLTRQALSPAQRQDLTLVCQLCGARYGRQNDLGAHLMQSHGALWKSSQEMLRFLIQTVQARHGCQCNPSCNDQGQTHICALLRQFAMIHMTSPREVLIPTTFSPELLTELLQPITHVPMFAALEVALRTRQFHKLWQVPGLVGMLKQWCVRCGNQHHPAALVIHHWQHHGEHSQWATQLKFQIVACLLKLQEQDMQCSFCGLMINPPLQPGTTMEPERFVNMQTHFASNCPVVHQTALLLQPIYGRVTDGARSTRSRAAGVVSTIRPTASSGQPIQARQGRRTAIQKSQARSRTRRKRSQHDPPANPGRHDGHDEGDGHLDPTTRTEHTASSSSRLIHLLLSNQS